MWAMLWVAIALVCLKELPPAAGDRPPPEYTVDLSLPASHRWDEVCRDYNSSISRMYAAFHVLLRDLHQLKFEDTAVQAVGSLPADIADELKAFARCTGATLADVATANLFYMVVAHGGTEQGVVAGTGVVAETQLGRVLHGRNFDASGFDSLLDVLRTLTITVTMKRGVDTVLRTTTAAGMVGVWTGEASHRFTVQGNQRFVGTVEDNVAALSRGQRPPSVLLREVLTTCTSYSDAVSRLTASPVAAPVYYIVGGLHDGEGTVLTRNTSESGGAVGGNWNMTSVVNGSAGVVNPGGWYIVETNYDLWEDPDERGVAAVGEVTRVGQENLDGSQMASLLGTEPMLNRWTVFTVVMSASDPDTYYSLVRDTPGLPPYESPAPTPLPTPMGDDEGKWEWAIALTVAAAGVVVAIALVVVTKCLHARALKRQYLKANVNNVEAVTYATFGPPPPTPAGAK